MVTEVKPMGGSRKVKALEHFAAKIGEPLSHWVTVGDSITDFNMLQAVDNAGGLAISFNANEYALPYSTMSLASTRLDDLWVILETWSKGDRSAVEKMVREKEEIGGEGTRGHFHWLAGSNDIAEPLKIHSRIRRLVRKEAAKLG
jgi:energy-converting hydrogenase A subunit R